MNPPNPVPLNCGHAVNAVRRGMTSFDYFQAVGLSQSEMKKLHPTPAHFLAPKDDDDELPSIDLVMGTMVHTLALSPEDPLPRVAVQGEEINLRTKAGREWRDEQHKQGLVVIKPDQVQAVRAMARAVGTHPLAACLFRSGHSEVSYFRTVQTLTGVPVLLKSRVDYVPANADYLVDVKTAISAEAREWGKHVVKFRYHCQAAHYLDQHNALCPDDQRSDMIFFVVEKRPPFLVAVYRLSSDFLFLGRRQVARDVEAFARATFDDHFPAYPTEPVTLHPPRWLEEEWGDAA